jgi:hypothetical protein
VERTRHGSDCSTNRATRLLTAPSRISARLARLSGDVERRAVRNGALGLGSQPE